jgi:protein SCO1/2
MIVPLLILASAGAVDSDVARGVGIDQKLNAQAPLNAEFRDEAGSPVRLRDYFDGKRPVILTLNYYECPMLCSLELNGLVRALRQIPFTAGKEFEIVTVSFDPLEKPTLARLKKTAYADDYGRRGAASGWHFLTGDAGPIRALTYAVGFRYRFDPVSRQYAHASGIFVLTPAGKVARCFYGIEYSPRDLRLALVDASAGAIGSPVDQVLLLCYVYNPATGKYAVLVTRLLRTGAILTVLALAGFIFHFARARERGPHSDAEVRLG